MSLNRFPMTDLRPVYDLRLTLSHIHNTLMCEIAGKIDCHGKKKYVAFRSFASRTPISSRPAVKLMHLLDVHVQTVLLCLK